MSVRPAVAVLVSSSAASGANKAGRENQSSSSVPPSSRLILIVVVVVVVVPAAAVGVDSFVRGFPLHYARGKRAQLSALTRAARQRAPPAIKTRLCALLWPAICMYPVYVRLTLFPFPCPFPFLFLFSLLIVYFYNNFVGAFPSFSPPSLRGLFSRARSRSAAASYCAGTMMACTACLMIALYFVFSFIPFSYFPGVEVFILTS